MSEFCKSGAFAQAATAHVLLQGPGQGAGL